MGYQSILSTGYIGIPNATLEAVDIQAPTLNLQFYTVNGTDNVMTPIGNTVQTNAAGYISVPPSSLMGVFVNHPAIINCTDTATGAMLKQWYCLPIDKTTLFDIQKVAINDSTNVLVGLTADTTQITCYSAEQDFTITVSTPIIPTTEVYTVYNNTAFNMTILDNVIIAGNYIHLSLLSTDTGYIWTKT